VAGGDQVAGGDSVTDWEHEIKCNVRCAQGWVLLWAHMAGAHSSYLQHIVHIDSTSSSLDLDLDLDL
jgi:hypothetical protein